MKYAILAALLLAGGPVQAAENPNPPAKTKVSPKIDQGKVDQDRINLCPQDLPNTCACVEAWAEEGGGVRVMPALEAYKNGRKVLLVGPR